jgi:hypothetical protein
VLLDRPVVADHDGPVLRVFFHNIGATGPEHYERIATSVARARADLVVLAHSTAEATEEVVATLDDGY